MRLFNYFSQTKLYVTLLLARKYNNYRCVMPLKYSSIKTIKQCYYENNIYLDIYNDLYNELNNTKLNSYTKYNDLTAEHIFPQSFTKHYLKANKDMHNIYLTNYYTNNLRSNKKFSQFVNENISTKVFIPCNYSRGLIARSLVYMKYTYPSLNLSSVIDYNIIILWNTLYPPNEFEFKKNNIIYTYQGNKNIFIEDSKKLECFVKKLTKQ